MKKPSCLVVIPDFQNSFFKDYFIPPIEKAGFQFKRVDFSSYDQSSLEKISNLIQKVEVVIVDNLIESPPVAFLLGLFAGLNIPIIHIFNSDKRRNMINRAFGDISVDRTLPDWGSAFSNELKKNLEIFKVPGYSSKFILTESFITLNPINPEKTLSLKNNLQESKSSKMLALKPKVAEVIFSKVRDGLQNQIDELSQIKELLAKESWKKTENRIIEIPDLMDALKISKQMINLNTFDAAVSTLTDRGFTQEEALIIITDSLGKEK